METPSSSRRVTRSQTLVSSANGSNLLLSKKVEDSEKTMTKSKKNQQQDRYNERFTDCWACNGESENPIIGDVEEESERRSIRTISGLR
ncbi:hypothetical protein ACS0TY_025890 [Phlomoides rotata]